MLFNKVVFDPELNYTVVEKFIYKYVMNFRPLAKLIKTATNSAKWLNISIFNYDLELRLCETYIRDCKVWKNGNLIVEL